MDACRHFFHGSCQCQRNLYTIKIPYAATEKPKVVFYMESHHQLALATPLAAYLRVPLGWLKSTTHAIYSDEPRSSIRRMYTSEDQEHTKRHFCGYCGTPLSFWTESPPSEAEYICMALGTLAGDHLTDLDDLGFIPEAPTAAVDQGPAHETQLRESSAMPWFDALLKGTRLGNMVQESLQKKIRHDYLQTHWEVIECTNAETEEGSQGQTLEEAGNSSKRKRDDDDESTDQSSPKMLATEGAIDAEVVMDEAAN